MNKHITIVECAKPVMVDIEAEKIVAHFRQA